MTALTSTAKNSITVEMQRDDVRIIESRGANAATIRKSFAKLHSILDKMPVTKIDTLADVRKMRESRGKA